MLITQFNSIQEMLEYNQAIQCTLELLYEYEADKWLADETVTDKLCDPSFSRTHFDEADQMFYVPCWIACEMTTGEDGWPDNDPYIPYQVEIPLANVVTLMKENYGYE